jgi:iron complex outermembrane receptor protein
VKAISTYHFERKRWQMDLTVYANRIGNYIFLKPSGITENIRGAYPYFRYQQTNILFTGADASISVDLISNFKLMGTASLIRAKNLGGNGELPFIPPNRFDAGMRWEQPMSSRNNFFGEVKGRFVSRQKNGPRVITPRQFQEANEDGIDLLATDKRIFDFAVAPDAYWLLNAAGGFSVKTSRSRLDFRLAVENSLNQSYREYTNRFRYYAYDRGRNFIFSIQYQF